MFYGFVCIAYVNICQQDMASSIFSSSFIGGSNEYLSTKHSYCHPIHDQNPIQIKRIKIMFKMFNSYCLINELLSITLRLIVRDNCAYSLTKEACGYFIVVIL